MKKIALLLLTIYLNSQASSAENLSKIAFRSSLFLPPKNYHGPIFKLNHNYPTTIPQCNQKNCAWLFVPVEFDFKNQKLSAEWQKYADIIQNTLKQNFYIQKNVLKTNTHWYGMPWMATNPENAQEFIHGAKYSFNINLQNLENLNLHNQLLKKQEKKSTYEVWSTAYYNEIAAYTLGQIWKKNGHLNWTPKNQIKGLPFAPGSIKVKFNLLTTTNLYPEYPRAEPLMMLYRHQEKRDKLTGQIKYDKKDRALLATTLAEIQVNVVDPRSPTGYVYLAYGFNPHHIKTQTGNLIDNFDLIGIQFGNDPKSFPAIEIRNSQKIHQSYFTRFGQKGLQGCGGRLITALGTSKQNCIGCHQTAYINKKGRRYISLYYPGTCLKNQTIHLNWSYYFKNLKYPQSYFSKDDVSLDASLRLQDAIIAYLEYVERSSNKSQQN